MTTDIPHEVHGDDLPLGVSHRTLAIDCEHVEKMLHKGTREHFVIYCDEPERMGGEDAYPPPLTYITSGIGF
ncbi:MAG: hypothetical protein OXH22_04700 [Chloroflexi bacterium]|nr:hypothetical protein [Chloroflexota bacterium]